MVDDSIMAMTSIHLAGIRADLIAFGPIVFGSFRVEMPDTHYVRWSILNLAFLNVILDVAFGNDSAHQAHEMSHVRQIFGSIYSLDAICAVDIVSQHDVRYGLVWTPQALTKGVG